MTRNKIPQLLGLTGILILPGCGGYLKQVGKNSNEAIRSLINPGGGASVDAELQADFRDRLNNRRVDERAY